MENKKKRDNNKRVRNKVLSIRLTEKEKDILKIACEKSQLSITDTLINLLNDFIK